MTLRLQRAGLWAAVLAALVAPIGAASGALAGPEAAEPATAVGVLPFERVAPEGRVVPDVAERLAERLESRGVGRVLGPAALGGEAESAPAPEAARGRAEAAGVDALVAGRVTRLGDALSIDAHLISGATGERLGTPLLEEASGPADLERAVGALAEALAARLEEPGGGLPHVGASGGAGAPGRAAEPKDEDGRGQRTELGSAFSSDAPISIRSDELEAFDRPDQRRFVFTGHVRAEQAELSLRSDRLEAFYPDGSSQPERLVATGHVVMVEGDRRATCERAVFHRDEERVVCTGDAQLEQGCDRVRGEEIVFHLDTEVMHVRGKADVRIHPDEASCAAGAEGPA